MRKRCASSRPTEHRKRIASCVAGISIEKIATGKPASSATFSAMLSENAVLPIEGRPATMIKSPACIPES